MNNSGSTDEIHFILDYLPLQTNLRVEKTSKREKTQGGGGKWGAKARHRQTD